MSPSTAIKYTINPVDGRIEIKIWRVDLGKSHARTFIFTPEQWKLFVEVGDRASKFIKESQSDLYK